MYILEESQFCYFFFVDQVYVNSRAERIGKRVCLGLILSFLTFLISIVFTCSPSRSTYLELYF